MSLTFFPICYNDINILKVMLEHKEHQPTPTEVASVWDEQARVNAASLALYGEAVGTYNRGVCAIWGDGANPRFPGRAAQIKGEKRGERPLAASLRTRTFVEMLDPTKISSDLHDLFLKADDLAARTSSLCFLRAPVTEAAAASIPASMISRLPDGTPILQNWDPEGHEPTLLLLEQMYQNGIEYPAVTSMNPSGTPELVTEEDGIRFSQERGIPLFLTDPRDPKKVKGSYTILGLHAGGIELVRDGNIPAKLIEHLLGVSIQRTERTIAPKHQQADFPETLVTGKHPAAGRVAIIEFVSTT
jgi:hypothetical protein